MFPPGKSRQEIRGFEIFRFPGSLCQDLGKCVYISKDFSDTDRPIYHTDIKNALALRYCKIKIFLLTKNYFSKFAKFFKTKCLWDQNFFFNLRCWNQKKCQNNQARKNFPQKFSGISRIYRQIFWKFSVSRVVENLRKRKTLSLAVSRTAFFNGHGPVLLLLTVQFCCFSLALGH